MPLLEPHAYSPPDFMPMRTLAAKRKMAASVARLAAEMRRFKPHAAVSFLNRAALAKALKELRNRKGRFWPGRPLYERRTAEIARSRRGRPL